MWSAQGVDERSLERQRALARHVIQTQLLRIPHDQQSVTIWDDAILNTKLNFKPRLDRQQSGRVDEHLLRT